MRAHWRRFKAKLRHSRRPSGDLAGRMHDRLDDVLIASYGSVTKLNIDQLHVAISEQSKRAVLSGDAGDWFALLVLRAPAAARAQEKMDNHPHTSATNRGRLYELIDFNDTFVSTVLALSPDEKIGFLDTLHDELARFCKRVGARIFSDEQYEAITRGLTREIAVYLGALAQGFKATMTSRAQDAMGVDMVLTDPVTGRTLNIDCKTSSAYRYRLQDLVREGRMRQDEAEKADLAGYAFEVNGHGNESVAVTLFRVDPNEVGEIKDFMFEDPDLLGVRLRELFQQNRKNTVDTA